MSEFKMCDGYEILKYKSNMIQIQNYLESAYEEAKSVKKEINKGAWQGEMQKAMAAYMDLMLQYHGALIGKTGGNPLQEAQDAYDELMDNLENLYSESSDYVKLKSI